MAYKITMNGGYSERYFEVINCDDAVNLVSLLVEFGKVKHRELKDDGKTYKETIEPLTVSMVKTDEEVLICE